MERQVTIEEEPQQVITFGPSATEVLFAIGVGDRVIATDNFSNYPEEAKELPKVGALNEVDVELIVELQPDLMVVLRNNELVQSLEKLGFTVYVKDPQTFAEIIKTMRAFGQLFNVQDQADKAAAELQAQADEISTKVSDIPEEQRPKVFYEVWNDPLMTAGPGSFISDIIGLAGGINIGDAAAEPWPTFNLETVVEEDPDVIITTFKETYDALLNNEREAWSSIKAVKNQPILLLDQDIVSRPSPRLVRALEQIATYLYPDRLK
jgi:iron complex transport system substrate-binding protein